MSSEGFLSLVAEGKLESSESIRETFSQCVFVVNVCGMSTYLNSDIETDRRSDMCVREYKNKI